MPKSKVHLFRSEYEIGEKIERIPAGAFTTETDEVDEFVQSHSEEFGDDGRFSKEEFLRKAQQVSDSDEEWEEFITSLFESEGKKGDPFNFKWYKPYTDLSFEGLVAEAPDWKGEDVSQLTDGKLDTVFYLTNWNNDPQSNTVDLQFKTAEEREDLTSDDDLPVKVIRKEDREVIEEYDSDFIIRVPFRHKIEARAYPNENMVIVSNFSGVSKSMQKDIVTITEKLSDRGGDDNAE